MKQTYDTLRRAARRLPSRDREIISLRFAGLTLREVGARQGGISRQRIAQIERRAIQRMAAATTK